MSSSKTKRRNIFKITLALGAVAALIVLGRMLPIGEWLMAFNEWVSGLGSAGLAIFIGVYIVCTVLFIPGSALTIGAGFAFGLAWGFAAVSAGSTIGAAAAFLVSRYLARETVREKMAGKKKFEAVDRAIGRQGAKVVLLLRLSPIFPFNALNYLLGLTAVPFWHYVAASWIGMLPGTFLYVYLGYIGRQSLEAVSAEGAGDILRLVYTGAGLVATVAVTWYVTKLARRELQEMPDASPTAGESTGH